MFEPNRSLQRCAATRWAERREPSSVTHNFTVRGLADPQTLPRVIGQLARRSVTPTGLRARLCPPDMHIEFETSDLSEQEAALVGATLRSCTLVHEVLQIGRAHV